MATQALGGYLADRYGGFPFLLVGFFGMAICTLLTPTMAQFHWSFILSRVLMGFWEGFQVRTRRGLRTVAERECVGAGCGCGDVVVGVVCCRRAREAAVITEQFWTPRKYVGGTVPSHCSLMSSVRWYPYNQGACIPHMYMGGCASDEVPSTHQRRVPSLPQSTLSPASAPAPTPTRTPVPTRARRSTASARTGSRWRSGR